MKREDIKKVEAMSRKYVPNMSDPVNFIIDPELTRNYEYINWLYSFMVCKDKVTDDLNEYEASFLTDVEKRNIMKLHQFHALVLDYYIKNNINIYKVDYGNYVKLFYQNEGLELGSYTGQGSYTYCRKIPIDNINEFVNFENIVKSNNVVRIKK